MLLSTTLPVIAFPVIDPIALQIGPIAIRWYALAYIAGLLGAWWYARRLLARPALWPATSAPYSPADVDDFLTWATLGVIIGGRLGYVLFYDPATYLADPLSRPARHPDRSTQSEIRPSAQARSRGPRSGDHAEYTV